MIGALAAALDPRLASWAQQASRPPSFEAYQAYVAGLEHYMRLRYPEALPLLRQAAAADPAFATPRLVLASAYTQLGGQADSVLRALDRARLSPFDRELLDWTRAYVAGDFDAAFLAAERAGRLTGTSEAFPLAAIAALGSNRPRTAIEALEAMDPRSGLLQGYAIYWAILGVGHRPISMRRSTICRRSPGRACWAIRASSCTKRGSSCWRTAIRRKRGRCFC